MVKREYQAPKAEKLEFDYSKVITTSGGAGGGGVTPARVVNWSILNWGPCPYRG